MYAVLGEAWLEATDAADNKQESQEAVVADGLERRLRDVLRPYRMTEERKELVAVEKRIVFVAEISFWSEKRRSSTIRFSWSRSGFATPTGGTSTMDLVLDYLSALRDRNGEFAYPVLLALLTVGSNKGKENDEDAAGNAASDASFKAARIATFLATSPHARPTGAESTFGLCC